MRLNNYKSITLLLLTFFFSFPLVAQDYAPSADKVSPVLINSTLPDVEVKDLNGKSHSMLDLAKENKSVFIFYRGGWCPYCNRHLADLKQIEKGLADMGYTVYAISADRPELLSETLDKNELSYTLLSDAPMTAAKALGIAFKVDDATVQRYKSVGIDLEADSGHDHHLLPAPAVFITDTEGIIKFKYVNPDYKKRIDGGILLAAAKAFM